MTTKQIQTVLLFAGAKSVTGKETIELAIESNATVGDLLAEMADQYPALSSLLVSSRVAVNQQFYTEQMRIPEGAEVALIPPVSGG